MRESLQRGLESLLATFLRRHVLDALLNRPEVVRSLSREAIERIRQQILEKLEASEARGVEDRKTVIELVRGLPLAGVLFEAIEGSVSEKCSEEKQNGSTRNIRDP